jgi:DNA primase
MLPSSDIECWQNEYENIILIFDNDNPGIEAMKKYQEKYSFIKTALLPLSKDISDSIRDCGAKKVRDYIVPILNKKINETQEDI